MTKQLYSKWFDNMFIRYLDDQEKDRIIFNKITIEEQGKLKKLRKSHEQTNDIKIKKRKESEARKLLEKIYLR